MQKLYQECNLVHADLSEYNMLWHEGKVRVSSENRYRQDASETFDESGCMSSDQRQTGIIQEA